MTELVPDPTPPRKEPPLAVIEAIKNAFPKDADEILKELRFHREGDGGYWSFIRWGMFVGIESDGYIHT